MSGHTEGQATPEAAAAGWAEPARRPFDRWLDAARPKASLWRTLVGVLIIVTVWMGWSFLVVLATILVSAFTVREAFDLNEVITSIVEAETPLMTLVILSTFLGLWFGVWIALRLMHDGQRMKTLFSPEGRVRGNEFAQGLLVVAGYLAINIGLSLAAGFVPYRSALPVQDWAVFALPVALLIYFQSSGEELAFRGYLVQQLGARFNSAIVWGFLPAFLFGWGHFTSEPTLEFGLYYVASTTLFGLVAAATIWRTGGLAAAMGLHVGNNIAAFLLVGIDDTMSSTQLWLWTADDMVNVSVFDLTTIALLLAYVLSPWTPFPRETALFGRRRKDTRAAP